MDKCRYNGPACLRPLWIPALQESLKSREVGPSIPKSMQKLLADVIYLIEGQITA